ncbi:MAG TPA: outer membrane beta-barrel protein [Xanthobacteraceae bacterium]|nr:outer membrane beta-barrel protein [Xanthobacteraceae bacterium]
MKNLISTGICALALAAALQPAAAADIPVAPVYRPAPAVVIFSWSGFYFGLHGGGGWGSKDATTGPYPFGAALITPADTTVDVSGWLAGGQFGGNYQVGMWVFGVEVAGSWANLTGDTVCSATSTTGGIATAVSATCSAKVNALGTVSGRLGVAFDRTLVYAKGGAAWTNDKYDITSTNVLLPTFNANESRWGWMAGGGVEFAFTDNWSVMAEYNYMDLGTRSLRFTDTTGLVRFDSDIQQRVHVAKVGVNYRLGGNTVVVRY